VHTNVRNINDYLCAETLYSVRLFRFQIIFYSIISPTFKIQQAFDFLDIIILDVIKINICDELSNFKTSKYNNSIADHIFR